MSDDLEVANTLNNYLRNVVKIFKIPEKVLTDRLFQSLCRHPTLNVILKYKNHRNMHAIKRFSRRFSSFYFPHVDKNTFLKEIEKINLNKAVDDSDILISLLITFILNLMKLQTHQSLQIFYSLQILQKHLSNVHEIKRKTTAQSAFCLTFQTFLKSLFAGKSQITLIIFYQNFNVVLEKATAHNIVFL